MSQRNGRPRWEPVDGVLLLDKPEGLTSNTALQRVRRALLAEKGGHTGSLDPLATGLLPICLGRATKICSLLLDADKQYEAIVEFGRSTETGDREGAVTAWSDPGLLDEASLRAELPRWLGRRQQIPPMYSALKQAGRPLYELARSGQTVDRPPREILLHELEIDQFEPPRFRLRVRCSKGTYIRTLAEDLASAVGQRAHLAGLRRTGLGSLLGMPMVTLAQVEDEGIAARRHLLPVTAALGHWPQWVADDSAARRLSRGQSIRVGGVGEGAVLVLDASGEALGIAQCDAQGQLQPRRWGLDRAERT